MRFLRPPERITSGWVIMTLLKIGVAAFVLIGSYLTLSQGFYSFNNWQVFF
jgi:hypothetical protein